MPYDLPDFAQSDVFFMERALHEAQLAGEEGEVPVGAVIVKDGMIIGRGRNACERLHDATAHAEILAITSASNAVESWRLEGCTLYVTLEPCPMCVGAALNARVDRIIYGAREPKNGACGSVVNLADIETYNHRLQVSAGCLAEPSAALLRDFFRALRARKREE